METGDRISERYKGVESPEYAQERARERIHWMCSKVEGPEVIDIGCSQGIASILLAREGFEVVGVDINAAAIEYANADRAKEPPEVQEKLAFINSSIYDIDLPAGKFHTAVMGEFLEHQVRPDKAITRAYELLADNGKLIITVPFGLFKDPDHKQTFYMASLYKLVHPGFIISEAEFIGRYLCLVCRKRKAVLEKQTDSIDLALVERAEQEFLNRETAHDRAQATRKKEVEKAKTERETLAAKLKSERETLAAQLNTTRNKAAKLKSERETLAAKLSTTRNKAEKLKFERETLAAKLKSERETLAAKLSTTRNKAEKLKFERETLAAQLSTTRNKVEELQSEREMLAAKLSTTRKEVEEAKAAHDTLASKLKTTKKEVEKSKTKGEALAAELSTTRHRLDRKQRQLYSIESSFAYQAGYMLVKAIRKPGRNTLLLPWHLVQLVRLRKRRHMLKPDKQTEAPASSKPETATEITRRGKLFLSDGKWNDWIALANKHRDISYFRDKLPLVCSKYRLVQHGFQPGPVAIPESYHKEDGTVFYLLHNSLPYATGGYAIRTHGLLKELVTDGWQMHGVTRPGFPFGVRVKRGLNVPQVASADTIPGVDVIDNVPYLRLFESEDQHSDIAQDTDLYIQTYVERLLALCLKYKPAIIHAATFFWNGAAAVSVARMLGLPSIYEVRALSDIARLSINPGLAGSDECQMHRRMDTDACLQATAVIAITKAVKSLLIERGVPDEKILVLPNGVDTDRFVPVPRDRELEAQMGYAGKKVIGQIGGFAPYEGLDYLLQAAAILRHKNRDDFRVLLVGDGPIFDDLQAICDELQLRDIVTIISRVPHQEVERYYSLIDIVSLPRKGMPICEIVSPLKPFEAMAMGKPVVASNVAALAEIVQDGKTGLLHKKDNVEHLAQTLENLLDNPQLTQTLGEAARKWVVANRDWRTLAKDVSDLYRDLIKTGAITPGLKTEPHEIKYGRDKTVAQTVTSPSDNKAHVMETIKERVNAIKENCGAGISSDSEPRRKDLKIAVIMDRFTYDCFKYEAELITFTPDNWKRKLSKHQPDLLFVESAWQGNDSTWEHQIVNAGQKPLDQLSELVRWCQTQDIPTAFWNKEDPAHYEEFLDAARLFDYVYTTDSDCIERYKTDLGHNNIFCLPFAVQPKIHNPIGSGQKIGKVAFAGSWYESDAADKEIRKEQMASVLEPALQMDVDIFDRHYLEEDDRVKFPELYQPYILGSLDYQDMVYAYRMYNVFLNVSSVWQSPTMFPRRVIEILASGTCVLSGYSRAIENLIGSNIVKMSSSPQETRLHLKELLENKELRDRLAHLGLRKVMKEHTCQKRLDYILQTMNMPQSAHAENQKGVSVVTCTNKPGFMENIFANYDRQQYEDKELIIILNNNQLNLDEWAAAASQHQNVSVYQVDENESLGTCLNFAIDKARYDYIAKFDDDDYYAPAYLEDMVMAFDYSGADIVGKHESYMYLEKDHTLAIRWPDRERHCFTRLVSGATMVIKRHVFEEVRFDSVKGRGSDTRFQKECLQKGFRIYSADRFNFVVIRKADAAMHTWQVPDKKLMSNSQVVCHTKDYAEHATC